MSVRAARRTVALLLTVACLGYFSAAPAAAQDAPAPASARHAEKQADKAPEKKPEEIKVRSVEDMLIEEIVRLKRENQSLREQLARAELDASQAVRERDEMRQFLADHERLGEDFEKYQGVLELKEKQLRRERAEEYREKVRQKEEERKARIEEAKAQRAAEEEIKNRIRRYEREGFYHVGSDVFVSGMAYLYKKENVPDTTIRFFPFFHFDGFLFRTRYWYTDYDEEIDYTEMTISGSVVNASPEPRNIGVAITFFDQYGNQIGGKTIEVKDARKDAPYPFTDKLAMALDRPFANYRIIVLYADPVQQTPVE